MPIATATGPAGNMLQELLDLVQCVSAVFAVIAVTITANCSAILGSGAGKVVINFAEPARETKLLKMTKGGEVKQLQNLRYTSFEKLSKATSLDEAF